MYYFVTIVYEVTSRNAINLLGSAIASASFLVSKQVLRCQRDDCALQQRCSSGKFIKYHVKQSSLCIKLTFCN